MTDVFYVIYLATLVWPISMPSLRSSPWILGAAQNGWRCSSFGSAGEFSTVQLLGRSGASISSATDLKPARCQPMTVSGFTIVSALTAFGTKRYSNDQAIGGTEGHS